MTKVLRPQVRDHKVAVELSASVGVADSVSVCDLQRHIVLGPHDGRVVGERVHEAGEDDVLASARQPEDLGVDGRPADQQQRGRQRTEQRI